MKNHKKNTQENITSSPTHIITPLANAKDGKPAC